MQAPNESFEDLARVLALSIADVLEHPDCPDNLADSLNDASGTLIDILTPTSISAHLRAVAGLAQSGDDRTRAEGETLVLDRTDAILGGSEQESEALAMTN
jgi:hypothetical protein